MLSKTSKYAIRALIFLELYSNAENKVGIKKIAGELDIPSPFLGKILQMLVKHQLLGSTKGPHGGFCLNKPAIDISLMEVVEIIDGKETFDNCVIRTSPCDGDRPCSMHHKLAPLRSEMKSLFTTETIADLVSEFKEGRERIRI
ncbi:MAG: Rrf2 family transcriptional regulator [Desulfobacteraceae bacterium]|jgi:Rrf2 family transcriptional regulator, iron-sulfur cluster assembly transcription factor|nr:Rrf2 family transcriptional regulator [Desulfobacteraceae bacterium]